jgi:hypothetical protein
VSTVQEIKAAIDGLSPVERAKLEHLLRQSNPSLDLEVDGPELEAELLKAAQGPFTPFSPEDLRKDCEAVLRTRRRE